MVVWEAGAPDIPTECWRTAGGSAAYHWAMGRIPGYYEWDDDSLTPGQKKEGGLHQNLFDDDGNLKGSARFVPSEDVDEDQEYETDYVTERVYVPAEERRLTPEQEELAELVGAVLVVFLAKGIEKAKPHVKKWWTESVRPAVGKQRARMSKSFSRKTLTGDSDLVESDRSNGNSDQVSMKMEVSARRPRMSSAEAQARYLAAVAARAFSEEQLSMIRRADVIDTDSFDEVEARIAELPPSEVRELISRMVTDPSMLSEQTLAELASILAQASHTAPREAHQLPRESN